MDSYEKFGLEDPKEEQARREKEELEMQKLTGAVSGLLATENGRFFLRWIVDHSGIVKDSIYLDAGTAAYASGRRSIGAKIIELCTKCKETTFLFEGDE